MSISCLAPSILRIPRGAVNTLHLNPLTGRNVESSSASLLRFSPHREPFGSQPRALPARENSDGPILVAGDSLVLQATKALQSWNLPSVSIIADGGAGSAPCDWEKGYTDPFSGRYIRFSQVIQETQPTAVVFAFTGNPGLEPHSTGCINSSVNYPLSALLASYKKALTELAVYASHHGAQVYISASPPRNPATPAGVYVGAGEEMQYGFNGVPALNRLYERIARSELGQKFHWTFDPYPAEYVSTPALTWRLTERCKPWDMSDCTRIGVRVRSGGLDAIHLDTNGAGAILYAVGLLKLPLERRIGIDNVLSSGAYEARTVGASSDRSLVARERTARSFLTLG